MRKQKFRTNVTRWAESLLENCTKNRQKERSGKMWCTKIAGVLRTVIQAGANSAV